MAGHVKVTSATMPQLQKGFEVPDGWVFHSIQPHGPEHPNWFYVIMTDEEAVTF